MTHRTFSLVATSHAQLRPAVKHCLSVASARLIASVIVQRFIRFADRNSFTEFRTCLTCASPLPALARLAVRWRAELTRRRSGACACLRGRGRPRQSAGLARSAKDRLPAGELEDFPEHADIAVECAPAAVLERHLPADARSRQAGDGAQRRRPAAAARSDRSRQGTWRTHPGADRRAARSRRRRRRRGGRHHIPCA